MTLIELLITMAIMAIISAAILGTGSAAMEAARRDRTKSTITKINSLIMERWASYETRRVDVRQGWINEINTTFPRPADRGAVLADLRLLALRETMKFEMPDRWSDVDLSISPVLTRDPAALLERPPAIAQTYYRRYLAAYQVALATAQAEGASDTAKTAADIRARYQGAECLFMTVMSVTGDGEARTQFSPQDIGDVDGDGAPEFIDGWGNPISWLRWPAGFVSRSTLMTGDSAGDHDPFDPFHRNFVGVTPDYSRYSGNLGPLQPFITHLREGKPVGDLSFAPGFRLVPLIYSSGPDSISDINTSGNGRDYTYLDPYAFDANGPQNYSYPPGAAAYEYGLPSDEPPPDEDGVDNSKDNIHNQLIEY